LSVEHRLLQMVDHRQWKRVSLVGRDKTLDLSPSERRGCRGSAAEAVCGGCVLVPSIGALPCLFGYTVNGCEQLMVVNGCEQLMAVNS
jgi:hypothetical protein